MRCCCPRSCSAPGSGWWPPARNAGRLRRDLHDGLGPILTAVTLKVAACSNSGHRPGPGRCPLAEVRGDAKQAIGDLRRIIYDLPAALDELGLLEPWASRSTGYRQGLLVTLQAPPVLPVPPAAVEVAAHRIVTEALTNIARHAHAGRATVAATRASVSMFRTTGP